MKATRSIASAWGPLDLDKVVNDLKTLGVKFSSDTNPRGYPSCNFVGGAPMRAAFAGCSAHSRISCRTGSSIWKQPDGVKVELVQHLEAGGIRDSKSQISNQPKSQPHRGCESGILDLGFGSWDLGFTSAPARHAARCSSGSPPPNAAVI